MSSLKTLINLNISSSNLHLIVRHSKILSSSLALLKMIILINFFTIGRSFMVVSIILSLIHQLSSSVRMLISSNAMMNFMKKNWPIFFWISRKVSSIHREWSILLKFQFSYLVLFILFHGLSIQCLTLVSFSVYIPAIVNKLVKSFTWIWIIIFLILRSYNDQNWIFYQSISLGAKKSVKLLVVFRYIFGSVRKS